MKWAKKGKLMKTVLGHRIHILSTSILSWGWWL